MATLIEKRLKNAELFCQQAGSKLTSIRKELLALIYQRNKPITAYELLDLFRETNPKATSMTIYRALDFLQNQKFIHRLASQTAYTACDAPHDHHQAHFLLCEKCGNAQEVEAVALDKSAKKLAHEYDFTPSDKPIEIVGTCKRCRMSK